MGCMPIGAEATGIANIAMDGTVLDTWYPNPALIDVASPDPAPTARSERVGAHKLSDRFLNLVGLDRDRLVEQVPIHTYIPDLAQPPVDAHDVYLRLHLLSHRLVKPLEINMDHCLEHLVPVVWTNKGPCLSDNFEFVRTNLRSRGTIHVWGIERLPRMVDYVVPSGVSIAQAERVRLGAYLAPGTSVLREGYVSYNAGTLGPARIEGRLSSAVVVDEGSDIAVSAVLMAAHSSDRDRAPMRVGKHCTLHPSSGLFGVELGDNCTVGVNVMLESESVVYDARVDREIPAREISGQSNLSIRREAFSNCPVVREHHGVD